MKKTTKRAKAKISRAASLRYWRSPKGQAAYEARISSPRFKEMRQLYEQSPKCKFSRYRRNSRKRRIPFALTFEQFMTYWRQACAYCGDKIRVIGLDRVDNALGYVIGNVTSCCATCNYMKRKWSREFFTAHCAKVAAHA